MYCFARWKRTSRGATPDLSRTAFAVVADTGQGSVWCLVALSAKDALLPRRAEPVPPDLRLLLESAKSFPPALALAARELRQRGRPEWQPAELSAFLVRALRRHLRGQISSGYFLAEVVRSEVGYLDAGEFVWILSVRHSSSTKDRVAVWVSRDFCIYENPASDFKLPRPKHVRDRSE